MLHIRNTSLFIDFFFRKEDAHTVKHCSYYDLRTTLQDIRKLKMDHGIRQVLCVETKTLFSVASEHHIQWYVRGSL